MKVFNCPVCRITPDITSTEIKCPKCGKTAIGSDLPETVKNWDEGNFTTKTVVKPVVEEVPVEKAPEKPVKAEKPAKEAKKPVKKPAAKKTTKK